MCNRPLIGLIRLIVTDLWNFVEDDADCRIREQSEKMVAIRTISLISPISGLFLIHSTNP